MTSTAGTNITRPPRFLLTGRMLGEDDECMGKLDEKRVVDDQVAVKGYGEGRSS